MTLTRTDIIAALATAPLPAGVAVVRLSGKGAKALADKLCPAFKNTLPRCMQFGQLQHKDTLLDEGLLVWFAAPNSFTGEEVVEFHGHGGRAVVHAVLEAMYALGAKPAEAGEFSRRAFLNGKIDLTQAEAMADLISANTEVQRQQALRQMAGELGTRFEAWRTDILNLVAHTEAAIDFPDEELDILSEAGLREKLETLLKTFKAAQQDQTGQRLREGFTIAILGRPNSGKSTLTNLLTGRQTAIVSPIEGTTRDVVEAHLDVAGYPVILADTAGLRQTEDAIEAEGVRRAAQKAAEADLIIALCSVEDWPNLPPEIGKALAEKPGLVIFSKVDIYPQKPMPQNIQFEGRAVPALALNLIKEQSLTPILQVLKAQLEETLAPAVEAAQLNRARHRSAVREAHEHLLRAYAKLENPIGFSSDMLSQDLRDAANAIGRVTGRTDTEAVLDVVFSTFCVGK